MKRNEIQRLRQEGYGYVRIAQMLGLSENSVKSFCRRHPLPTDDSHKQTESTCPQCGTKVDSRRRFGCLPYRVVECSSGASQRKRTNPFYLPAL